jgi:CMP-N-acetylneuraminic acid synthetase
MNNPTHRFLGIIPARGGSKSIPKKNIKKLLDKPLIQYTIDAVQSSKLIDRCIVSTDSQEIANYCKQAGIDTPFLRPADLSSDTAKSIDVVLHALAYLKKEENYIPDYIVLLQPTSPLRLGSDIDEAIQLMANNKTADSLVSVVEVPHNFHPQKIMTEKSGYVHNVSGMDGFDRRQDMNTLYARNGAAIYIARFALIMERKKFIGSGCIPYLMPKERSIDIDDDFDWKLAALLLKDR